MLHTLLVFACPRKDLLLWRSSASSENLPCWEDSPLQAHSLNCSLSVVVLPMVQRPLSSSYTSRLMIHSHCNPSSPHCQCILHPLLHLHPGYFPWLLHSYHYNSPPLYGLWMHRWILNHYLILLLPASSGSIHLMLHTLLVFACPRKDLLLWRSSASSENLRCWEDSPLQAHSLNCSLSVVVLPMVQLPLSSSYTSRLMIHSYCNPSSPHCQCMLH